VVPWADAEEGPVASAAVVIGNAAPTLAGVDITPDPAQTGDDLTATPNGWNDADGDAAGYDWQWEKDTGGGFAVITGETTATLASTHFASGDTVRVTCTPKDGTDAGAPVTDTLTIGNTAPTLASVEIAPDAPVAGDDLQATPSGWNDVDGSPAGYDWQWEKDTGGGFVVIAGENADTLAATHFAKGDQVRVTCTPNDGTDTGAAVTDTVTIGDTPPTAPTVDVTPDTPLIIDYLVVDVSGSTDVDGDAVTYSYHWEKNGTHQPALDDQATVPAAQTSSGETWTCTVTPIADGQAGPTSQDSVTITNSAPTVAAVDLSPDPALTTDDLLASPSGWSDADGDAEGYSWQWEKDTGGGFAVIAGATTDTLASEHFAKGDRIRVTCTPDDGTQTGTPVSDTITVSNTAPGAPATCEIEPGQPTPSDDLTSSVGTAQDEDGDGLTYVCQWRCSTDGGTTWDAWGRDGDTLPAADTANGEWWQARTRADDGDQTGPWTVSDPVQIWVMAAHSSGAGTCLMGVPLQPFDPAPGTVFPGCQVIGDWGGDGYLSTDVINLGRGYWICSDEPMDIEVRGTPLVGDTCDIHVEGAGWHMLANPFAQAMDWAGVKGDGLAHYGWRWDAEGHRYLLVANMPGLNLTSRIPAWSGFWAKTLRSETDVQMTRDGVGPEAVETMSVAPEGADDWVLQLTASVGGCSDTDNWIGSLQRGDVRLAGPPPPADGYVDLYLTGPTDGRDAVRVAAASGQALAWDVVVETNVGSARVAVEYPDLSSVPAGLALYLTDCDTGARQYMRTTSRYVFQSGEEGAVRHLRIEAVPETGEQLVLDGVRAMQTTGGVEISYTLSRAASVDVTILNIAGRVVRTLRTEQLATAGTNTETWNLIGDRGTAVPAGQYLCRVTARTDSGRQTSNLVTMQVGR